MPGAHPGPAHRSICYPPELPVQGTGNVCANYWIERGRGGGPSLYVQFAGLYDTLFVRCRSTGRSGPGRVSSGRIHHPHHRRHPVKRKHHHHIRVPAHRPIRHPEQVPDYPGTEPQRHRPCPSPGHQHRPDHPERYLRRLEGIKVYHAIPFRPFHSFTSQP